MSPPLQVTSADDIKGWEDRSQLSKQAEATTVGDGTAACSCFQGGHEESKRYRWDDRLPFRPSWVGLLACCYVVLADGMDRCKYSPEALEGYLTEAEEGEGPNIWTHDLELESGSDRHVT
jgi:hypothetical protein